MQTQKHLISSINKQTHRLDSSNKSKLSQTRLVLRCDNCGGLPKNHNEVLSINYGFVLTALRTLPLTMCN